MTSGNRISAFGWLLGAAWIVVALLAIGFAVDWTPGPLLTAGGLIVVTATWAGVIARRAEEYDASERSRRERKENEEVVRAAVSRNASLTAEVAELRATLDAVDEPVIAFDRAGRVLTANVAAEDFLGTRLDPEGRRIDDIFTQAEIVGMHAAAAGGQSRRTQVRIPRSGTPRVFEVSAVPTRSRVSGTEPRVVLTLRDVTELAFAVQLKTDFVGNASHEFRTPLSAIKAAVETLDDDVDPPIRERFLRMIRENVARLEELTRDLLDLSRLETMDAAVEPGVFDAREVVESLRAMLEPSCRERSLAIRADIEPELARMRTDQKLFTLILKNLLENSTKFAYEGTEIRVVGRVIAGASDSAIPVASRWQVIDRGIGIPLNAQQRIFERFYQVDSSRSGGPKRRGTGLGLSIVKHAVKRLGGSISVDSVWKEGTVMTIELPATVEAHPLDA